MNGIRKKGIFKSIKQLDDNTFLKEAELFFVKEEAQKLLLSEKATIAFENKDYITYEKIMLDKYKNEYFQENPFELAFIAGNFADNIQTKSSLETAVL
ncbi:hypothetical protein D1631_05925 [Chryseobacterium nematophagum]|uniref:Uncharacterized protein n=1 Tax=Chryseobacterium nematophagum TaxID=2305228 RepID=A0A3M7TFU1_9FLAO|nr:hypothetical protein [Chryseobacterium nematophagum]RNA61499.1 hypothetical protein D1631_05925 [Chryseobacterium nematophagum]